MQTQEVLSEDIEQSQDGDGVKLVPVAESIRYRKRAQSAEKQVESLSERLTAAQQQIGKLGGQLSDVRNEQQLTRKLILAGVVDIESALLLAKARMQEGETTEPDEVIERLKKEKQFLFVGSYDVSIPTPGKTAGAKERSSGVNSQLEKAAKKAASTGNRADLQEYLRLRRNYL